MKKIIAILGKGELAIRVSEWFYKDPEYLLFIIPVIPEPTWTNSLLDWTKGKNVTIVTSGNFKDVFKYLEDKKIFLAISVFYDKIIDQNFIERCKKIINIHNSPLPKYRGVSPINWALKNNEAKHGITIHEITAGIDNGPIIAQLEYYIYPEFDEVIDVYNRAIEYGWVLFKQTIPILDKIIPRPQDESLALCYNKSQDKLLQERKNFTRNESL
jgi:methionyl-tRNA formyltransferase